MEEQTSWKGHTFTLLVFAGIVFLCSIFFVLGMLVGQNQSRSAAEAATVAAASKEATAAATAAPSPTSEGPSPIAPYENVPTGSPVNASTPVKEAKENAPAAAPDTVPAKKAAPVVAAPAPVPAPARPSVKMGYFQVAATAKEAAAKKLVDELNKKGFPALIMDGSADKLFHVQVGPFSNEADAATAKSKLEALGYKPIRK